MQRATGEIVVDEARTKDYLLCAVVMPSEDPAPGPHDDAGARVRTTADRLHRRDERPENRRRIVAAFARTPEDPAGPAVHRADRRSPAPAGPRLLAALAVHSTGLGARRILVESCAQDKQDLAALTGALAHVGAPTTVRAMVDRRHAHELLWAADLIAYAYTAGGQLRRAIDSLVTAARVR
ncbi:hypothetical protein [Rhodococcus sp. LW-XY12]|uniref:hypothetical protein n=1 Tax=Rhodococcus sp. LW-XY12 TaxID=2856851 RepID=UPI001C5A05DB|nr:hypothetical protein [Rhodococcus sp. LW-XY12]QXU56582.1 hypothetical protein KXC42_26015 [Rhodococcus sp. LW-XY12]